MSLSAYKWAKTVPGLSGTSKSILIYLADRFNDAKGYAWPSLQRMTIDTGWSKRTIQRALASLQAEGLVVVCHQFYEYDGSYGPNRYYLPSQGECPAGGTRFTIRGSFDVDGNWDEDLDVSDI